jgi:hypothetical protein
MGFSYYVSIQALLFVYLVSQLPLSLYFKAILPIFLLFMLMVIPAFFFEIPEQVNSIFNSLRQFFCLAVLVTILKTSNFSVRDGNQMFWVITVLLILCIATIVQLIGLQGGVSLTPPASLLVANAGTLEAMQFAASLGMTEELRPSAFYGEPSYLAFVCISLLYVAYSWRNAGKAIFYASLLCLVMVITSRSLSAFLSYVALSIVYLLSKQQVNLKIIFSMLCVGLAGVSYLVFSDGASWLASRLSGIISMDSDHSSTLRLIAPFFLIEMVFQDYFFGVPSLALGNVFGNSFEDGTVLGTDNGFLNLFINFGYSGFLIVFILFFFCRKNVLLLTYLILASMFNGAFLSIDKIAVIGFVILLSRSSATDKSNLRTCEGKQS